MHKRVTLLFAIILCASTMAAAELTASDLDKRRKALNDLLTEQWEYVLRTNPEFASILGDKRFNDKASEISMAAIQRDLAANRRFLRGFEAIDTIGFSDQEKINKTLMVKNLRDGIEDTQLKEYEMPVNQMGGWHLFAAQLPALLTFNTAKDYDDYAARLRALPAQMDGTIDFMRHAHRERSVAALDDFMNRQAATPLPFAVVGVSYLAGIPAKPIKVKPIAPEELRKAFEKR